MTNKKQIQATKRRKMMSLQRYLQNQAAERADKLQFRQARQLAKLAAEKNNKRPAHEEHIHTEECNHEH
jgi:hypothetical protein